jgi:hypothetical protein
MVDYVDFLQIGTRTYLAAASFGTNVPTPSTHGAAVSTVRCSLRDTPHDRSALPAVDGTAGNLPAGTILYAVPGHDPSCEVVALVHGSAELYVLQVEHNRQATISDCWRTGLRQ